MTRIEFIYDDNIILGFKMEGHARFNTEGPDILCASLSTASQMTINGILDWTGLSCDNIIKKEDPVKALLHIEVPDRLYFSNVVQQLFRSFKLYAKQLEEQYSEYVCLERSEINDNKDK